jgi:ABC-type nitrate/sulfonate/bicarbonate transport system substrate-binding protein
VAQKPPHFIIAQPGIKTVQELRGKRFGVLSLHEGTTYFVQDIETAIGFKRGDIIIDAVGGAPTRWKLLREGKIDAGLQPFPLSYESEAAGFSNLGPISKYVPDYEFTAVFVDPAWGNANKPAVTGFLRALRRGQAAMAADPDKAAAVLVRELSTTPDYARRAIGDALKFKLMPDGLAASAAGMRRVFDTLQRAGLVPNDQPFDIGRFVDPSYLATAR